MDGSLSSTQRELLERLRVLHSERANPDILRSLWPQVKAEWLLAFPESRHVIERLDARLPEFAMVALLRTAVQKLLSEEEAQKARAETQRIQDAMASLLGGGRA